jgi:hypothetical protein
MYMYDDYVSKYVCNDTNRNILCAVVTTINDYRPNGMMEVITGPKAKDFSQGELTGMLKEMNYEKDNVYKF